MGWAMVKGKLYKTTEVAEMLDVSPSTVRYWIKKGWLKAIRVGKHFKIKEEDLNEFINRGVSDNGKAD